MRHGKPSVRGGLTRPVDHSSTEPRVGSSNLSGRANPSGNQEQTAVTTGVKRAIFSGRLASRGLPRSERNFLAACLVCGIAEDSARRLLAAIRRNARRACAGVITGLAAQKANQELTARVLASRPAAVLA